MLKKTAIVRTYIPITDNSISDFVDESDLTKAAPAFAAILELLRKSSAVGVLGKYDAVFEATLGIEGFTPRSGSNPTLGKPDLPETTRTVVLTTYLSEDFPLLELESFVEELAKVHPWEYPVIEVHIGSGSYLWCPS